MDVEWGGSITVEGQGCSDPACLWPDHLRVSLVNDFDGSSSVVLTPEEAQVFLHDLRDAVEITGRRKSDGHGGADPER
jgi:hypothetical protein